MSIYHYLSPMTWDTSRGGGFWRAPDGCVLGLDTRGLPDQALAGSYGDWSTAYVLSESQQSGEGFTLLGQGRVEEVRPTTQSLKDAWQVLLGVAPVGDTLLDWIVDLGTDDAVVDGSQPMKPLLPTREGIVEVWLPLHSRVYAAKFGEWNPSGNKYHNRIRDLLRADFKSLRQQCKDDSSTLGKRLSVIAREYGCDPKEIDSEIQPQRPNTTYTDSFTGTNGDSLGANWGDASAGSWTKQSNSASCSVLSYILWQTTLESQTHYAQAAIVWSGLECGTTIRATKSSSPTAYACLYSSYMRLCKVVAGTLSYLASKSISPGNPQTYKLSASGSTITFQVVGVDSFDATDTALTGLYVGMRTGGGGNIDDWVADDGIVAGQPTIRRFGGVPFASPNRGVW